MFEYIVKQFKCVPVGLYRGSKLDPAGHRIVNESSTAVLPYTYTNPIYNCPLHVEHFVLAKKVDLSSHPLAIHEDKVEFQGDISLIQESFKEGNLLELKVYDKNMSKYKTHIFSIRKVSKHNVLIDDKHVQATKTVLYTKYQSGCLHKYNSGFVNISKMCAYDRLFVMGRSSALQQLKYDSTGSDAYFMRQIAAVTRIQAVVKKRRESCMPTTKGKD